MTEDDPVDKLLSHYRWWGIAAVCFLVIFISLLTVLMFVPGAPLEILYVAFVCGLLLLGTTAFSRHALVILKRHMGREVSLVHFLSTQLVSVLFPIAYRKVKEEVRLFKKKQETENRS